MAGAKAEDLRARLRASVLEALTPAPPNPAAETEEEPPKADAGEDPESPPEETDETAETAELTDESTAEEAEDKEDAESPKEKARLEEIRNLRSDRRALRDEVTELKERLTQAEQAAATPSASPAGHAPLANVKTIDQLRAVEGQLKTQVRAIEDYLDESLDAGERANFEEWARKSGHWNTEADRPNAMSLKKLKRLGEEILAQDVPARREYLSREPDISRKAEMAWPWWKDKDSEEYALAQDALARRPWLKNEPDWKAVLSVYVLGVQTLQKQLRANGGPKKAAGSARLGNPKLPTATVALPTAAARPQALDHNAALGAAIKTGDKQAMKTALVAMLE
ncbi:MAG: hypothetical protein HW378_191 [Anaerolineales bacterium]|nr:hypothetical protein [Anaerolineales bacterium]